MKKIICLLSIVVISSPAFAFKWKECKDQSMSVAGRNSTKAGNGSNFLANLGLTITCDSTSSTSTSTFGFTSSTSKCGLFAMREQREEFMRANLYDVKMDVARGHGEYLNSLASLSGCDDEASMSRFGGTLRVNFKRVFSNGSSENVSPMTQQIDQLIQEDEVLVRSCAFNG